MSVSEKEEVKVPYSPGHYESHNMPECTLLNVSCVAQELSSELDLQLQSMSACASPRESSDAVEEGGEDGDDDDSGESGDEKTAASAPSAYESATYSWSASTWGDHKTKMGHLRTELDKRGKTYTKNVRRLLAASGLSVANTTTLLVEHVQSLGERMANWPETSDGLPPWVRVSRLADNHLTLLGDLASDTTPEARTQLPNACLDAMIRIMEKKVDRLRAARAARPEDA